MTPLQSILPRAYHEDHDALAAEAHAAGVTLDEVRGEIAVLRRIVQRDRAVAPRKLRLLQRLEMELAAPKDNLSP